MNLNDTKLLQVIDGLIKEREALQYLKGAVALIVDNRTQLDASAATLAAAQEKLAGLEATIQERETALANRLAEKQKIFERRRREMDEDLEKRQAAADHAAMLWKASLAKIESDHSANLAEWQTRIDIARKELSAVTAQLEQAQAHRASLMASLQLA